MVTYLTRQFDGLRTVWMDLTESLATSAPSQCTIYRLSMGDCSCGWCAIISRSCNCLALSIANPKTCNPVIFQRSKNIKTHGCVSAGECSLAVPIDHRSGSRPRPGIIRLRRPGSSFCNRSAIMSLVLKSAPKLSESPSFIFTGPTAPLLAQSIFCWASLFEAMSKQTHNCRSNNHSHV